MKENRTASCPGNSLSYRDLRETGPRPPCEERALQPPLRAQPTIPPLAVAYGKKLSKIPASVPSVSGGPCLVFTTEEI